MIYETDRSIRDTEIRQRLTIAKLAATLPQPHIVIVYELGSQTYIGPFCSYNEAHQYRLRLRTPTEIRPLNRP